jgi:hypothetical protein
MGFDYAGKKVSLLTKHGKQDIIAPILARAMGCETELITAVDTDDLGTFDRLIDRQGTQLQTARRKAHIGIDNSANCLGIASEGSFVADPYSGFMPWNIEMVVFIDDLNAIEVVGMAQGSAMSASAFVRDVHELMQFATDAGFPSHHLMLRPESQNDPRVRKGISDLETLKEEFINALAESHNGKVFVENDLRAHCNPTRQKMIAQATEDLVQKMRSPCPVCTKPGYWKTKAQPGRPCGACGAPTQLPVCEIWSCHHCGHESHQPLPNLEPADMAQCDVCNP